MWLISSPIFLGLKRFLEESKTKRCSSISFPPSLRGFSSLWVPSSNSLPTHPYILSHSANLYRPLVFVSSFSIFALIFSFIILLIYGFSTYGAHIDKSVLMPPSWSSLFSSMGVPAFSLGYNFSFLSFYVSCDGCLITTVLMIFLTEIDPNQ